jgi:hypothetical protein
MTASFFRRGQAGISQSPTVPDFLEHSDGGIDGYTRFAINNLHDAVPRNQRMKRNLQGIPKVSEVVGHRG